MGEYKPLEDTYEHFFRERLNEYTGRKRNLISNSYALRELLTESNHKNKIHNHINDVIS